MDVQTFRAASLQEALLLVRQKLGPDAAVLHTREVRGGLRGWFTGKRAVEISATTQILPPRRQQPPRPVVTLAPLTSADVHGMDLDSLASPPTEKPAMRSFTPSAAPRAPLARVPESLFHVFASLIEADVPEDLARELVEKLHHQLPAANAMDPESLKIRLVQSIEDDLAVSGPIRTQAGKRKVVALVGPTGVGKTTTIAKLAAHFRLKERKRVGLITVDTFRIAAVEQLRAYADIIDLPMEVVSTPAEMQHAMARLTDLDLILMDTAGRSPRDEMKLRELKAMFAEARPDEVHLVLSATCGAAHRARTVEQFAEVGITSLMLTKVDEAHGLGSLLPLVRTRHIPLSYLTNGQNVPDDIQIADRKSLARMMIGIDI